MSEQRHIIKRQLIELQVADTVAAQQYSDEFARLYRQRIVPMIGRYCDALSTPDSVQRIDKLELDIGRIDPQYFEQQLLQRIEQQLKQKFAELNGHQPAPSTAITSELKDRVSAQLELFEQFALTGSLPWWADLEQPELLEQVLQTLLQNASMPLRDLLRRLLADDRALQRLINAYADVHLVALLNTLLTDRFEPSLIGDPIDLIVALQASKAFHNQTSVEIRAAVWRTVCCRQAGVNLQ